jgi:hypothetical protein
MRVRRSEIARALIHYLGESFDAARIVARETTCHIIRALYELRPQ